MYLQPAFQDIQPSTNPGDIPSQWQLFIDELIPQNSDPQPPQQSFFSHAAIHHEAPQYPLNPLATYENLPNLGVAPTGALQVYIIPICNRKLTSEF